MIARMPRRLAVVALTVGPLLAAAATAPALAGARDAGRVPGGDGVVRIERSSLDEEVSVTLVLRFPGKTAMEEYIAAQHRSAQPDWLTATEIGERFGLPATRIDAVVARLEAAGIHVTERFDQRTALIATGTVRAVERFFRVRLDDVRVADGSRVHVPSRPPRIPHDLSDAIARVEGLDTRPVFQSNAVYGQASGAGSSSTYVTPTQLGTIYGAASQRSAGVDGRGETIAIASLARLHGEEVPAWGKRVNVDVSKVKTVSVSPAPAKPGKKGWSGGEAAEVALDVEMTLAIAPGATILNYTTQNDGASLDRIVNRVVQDGRASILTMSWGTCESGLGRRLIRLLETSYAVAEAAGVDMFASSGDSGPYGCNGTKHANDRRVSVTYPASSAHIAAVGGSTLIVTPEQTLTEEAWQEPGTIFGAGGGVSTYVTRPSWQLTDVVHDTSASRVVPDIAGPASPSLNLIVSQWRGGKVAYFVAGGTSAAAPFWAGATAIAKQYARAQVGQFADGNVKIILYRVAASPNYGAVFHDVKTGQNALFAAAPGWDFITGLGSPNIGNLALAFADQANSR